MQPDAPNEEYRARRRAERKRHEAGMIATVVAAGIAQTSTGGRAAVIAARAVDIGDALWEELERRHPREDR